VKRITESKEKKRKKIALGTWGLHDDGLNELIFVKFFSEEIIN